MKRNQKNALLSVLSLLALAGISLAGLSCSTTSATKEVNAMAVNAKTANANTANAKSRIVKAAKAKQRAEAKYMAEVRSRHPEEQPIEIVFHAKFRELKAAYARTNKSIFKDPSWPLFLETRALEAMQKDAARESVVSGIPSSEIPRQQIQPLPARPRSPLNSASSLNSANGLNTATFD